MKKMKFLILCIVILQLNITAFGQQKLIDSLEKKFQFQNLHQNITLILPKWQLH